MKKQLLKLLGVDNLSKVTVKELAELYIKDLRKLLGDATRKSDIKKLEDAIAKRPEVVKQKAESRGLLKPRKKSKRAKTTTETEPVVERKKSPVASKKKTGRAKPKTTTTETQPVVERKKTRQVSKPKTSTTKTKPETTTTETKPKTTTTETKPETTKDKNQLEFKFKKSPKTSGKQWKVSAETRQQIAEAQAKIKAKRDAAAKKLKQQQAESKNKPPVKRKTVAQNEDVAYHKRYYRKGGTKKRPQMVHGGSHKSKKHSYAAGGSVKELKLFK